MYTLDTNIIIYYLKDDPKVVKFLHKKIFEGSRFFISTISEAELFSYPEITEEEVGKIDKLLKTVSVISIDSQIAQLAGFFKRKYGIDLADAIIAATTYLTNSALITRNIRHFKKVKEFKKIFI